MENIPQLTIVMPFYNQKEMVSEMIDSILANEFQNWELLAIDDGSSQETIDFLAHYQKDQRIRIIKRTANPKGAQTCRNMGMEIARGNYIVFFDSDDYITSTCLSTRIKFIEQRPDLDFAVFPSGIYKDGIFSCNASKQIYGYPIYMDDVAAFSRKTLPFIVWNNIYRTESLRRFQMTWDPNLLSLQDSEFNMQALIKGLKYDYAHSQPNYGYRIATTGSVSKKITTNGHRKSHLYLIEKQYKEVIQKYGRKYNHDLYLGVLYVFTVTMPNGIDFTFAKDLADIVRRYDPFRGRLLVYKIRLCKFLGLIVNPKIARQLSMPLFLIKKFWAEKTLLNRITITRNKFE